jgi:hypothetical protein
MTATLSPELTDQLTSLAAQLAKVLDQKNQIEEQEKRLKTQIRELVPGPDSYPAGPLTVTVSPNNRFNPEKALPLIPEALLPVVTRVEIVVDRDKLKVLLPDVYAEAQTAGDWRIGLK